VSAPDLAFETWNNLRAAAKDGAQNQGESTGVQAGEEVKKKKGLQL
jgi:hypothetical protein